MSLFSKEEIDNLLCYNIINNNPDYRELISFLNTCYGVTFKENVKFEKKDFLKICKEIDASKTNLIEQDDIPLDFLTPEKCKKILEMLINQLSNDKKPDFDKIYKTLGITHFKILSKLSK